MPSWLPEFALSAFPAAATLRVVPLHGDPGRNVYPLLHPRPPLASSTFSLPPAVASRSPPSAHNSSPCACSRWLLLCSHPEPHVPTSALPPLTPGVIPAGTVFPALANEVSENPLWSGIRLVAGRQYAESHVFHQTFLNPARGKHSHAIPIQQDLCHHARVIRWLTSISLFIDCLDRRKVQLVHHIRHTVSQVILRQPITKARR